MCMRFHGSISSPQSEGANELIKQGAIPICNIGDFEFSLW